MASISYDGQTVQNGVNKLQSISSDLSSYSSDIYSATKMIVNANGFDRYVGGITANTFSDVVDNFQSNVQALIDKIRQGQMQILTYSKDKNDITFFLNSLTDEEKSRYNLDNVEKLKDRSNNIFARGAATLGTGIASIFEGVLDFGETGADLLVMAGSGLATIFTAGIDFFTGKRGDDSLTQRLWKWTQGFVADKKVENIFNNFYSNTSLGKTLKANSYGFETVRSVGKGIGYTAGVVGLTILTGGLATGAGVATSTAAGSISASQLALTAGVMGFSNGTEEAWSSGANLIQGVGYGLASGAWEGAQWFAGGKISQIGGATAKGVLTRMGLDTVDAAADAFVKPALNLIYDNDPTKNLAQNYKEQFEDSGGWGNVAKQAAFGATLSGVGELVDARKLLKENRSASASTSPALEGSVQEVVGTTTAIIDGKVVEAEILSAPKTNVAASSGVNPTAAFNENVPVITHGNTFVNTMKDAGEAITTREFRQNAVDSLKDNMTSYISAGASNIDTDVVKKEVASNKLANIIMGDKNRVNLTEAMSNIQLENSNGVKKVGSTKSNGSTVKRAMTTVSVSQ